MTKDVPDSRDPRRRVKPVLDQRWQHVPMPEAEVRWVSTTGQVTPFWLAEGWAVAPSVKGLTEPAAYYPAIAASYNSLVAEALAGDPRPNYRQSCKRLQMAEQAWPLTLKSSIPELSEAQCAALGEIAATLRNGLIETPLMIRLAANLSAAPAPRGRGRT